jgi:hypothetical protein
VSHGSSFEDISRITAAIGIDRPVLVAVRISGGRLVSSGGTEHWAMVVGYDQNYGGQLILNDPGTNSGNKIRYSLTTFDNSWRSVAMDGYTRVYVPCWR